MASSHNEKEQAGLSSFQPRLPTMRNFQLGRLIERIISSIIAGLAVGIALLFIHKLIN